MKILNEKERTERDLPDCFGTCLGGTECWEACGEREDKRYLECLLQAHTLVSEALEAEILEVKQ